MRNIFISELNFLKRFETNGIIISTSAKEPTEFLVLPRREFENYGLSTFMINNEQILKETLKFYDGLVDCFYIDVELKQSINLYKIAHENVISSKIVSIKPNDITVESLDLLLRDRYKDNFTNKNILVIGTGNLATKIIIRFAERQANIFVLGRSERKTKDLVFFLNQITPLNTPKIRPNQNAIDTEFDIVISAISGQFTDENLIRSKINDKTTFIDVGINNFRETFINERSKKGNTFLRLDTRIALPYQMLYSNKYTEYFIKNIIGKADFNGVTIVSGGLVGKEGDVIVDRIDRPTQLIGLADGSGGVKKNATDEERAKIKTIQRVICKNRKEDL